MCIKAGKDELESVKNLMLMSLTAAVAEALQVEFDAVTPGARLVDDLGMDRRKRAELEATIADFFDGLKLDLRRVVTVGSLFEQVVLREFSDGAACAAA